MLVAMRHSSDKDGDSALSILADAENRLLKTNKRGSKRTLASAYEDRSLVGGGFSKLKGKLFKKVVYCTNQTMKHGKMVCARKLPDGHSGSCCPYCQSEVAKTSKSKKGFLNVDYMLDLEEVYNVLFTNTDIAQRICDYYPISISRLSTPLTDPQARVFCVASAQIATEDFADNPHRFELDVEAKPGEFALHRVQNELRRVKVIVELRDGYLLESVQTGDVVLEENKSAVEKLGGHFPVIVVVYDDGAEVYQSQALQYSNTTRTEEMICMFEKHRRRQEFSSVLGTTAGGVTHYNVHERNVFFELQRRKMQRGFVVPSLIKVLFNGRLCVCHSPTITRNPIMRNLDEPERVKQAGTTNFRNPFCLAVFVDNFEAVLSGSNTVYSFLKNRDCTPRDEATCRERFQNAEQVRVKFVRKLFSFYYHICTDIWNRFFSHSIDIFVFCLLGHCRMGCRSAKYWSKVPDAGRGWEHSSRSYS
jgi:hypothetical protein